MCVFRHEFLIVLYKKKLFFFRFVVAVLLLLGVVVIFEIVFHLYFIFFSSHLFTLNVCFLFTFYCFVEPFSWLLLFLSSSSSSLSFFSFCQFKPKEKEHRSSFDEINEKKRQTITGNLNSTHFWFNTFFSFLSKRKHTQKNKGNRSHHTE